MAIFGINKSVNHINSNSVFGDIVKEIDILEIPTRYIERISLYYDGTTIDLSGKDLIYAVPMNINLPSYNTNDLLGKTKDIAILINIEILEKDVDIIVEKYLGAFC